LREGWRVLASQLLRSPSSVIVLLEMKLPKAPAPLIGVSLGILLSLLLGLKALGVDLIGEIPPGLPSLSLPDFSVAQNLWGAALGIGLMSFIESIAAAKAFARADDPPLNANRELLSLGAANLAGGFFGSMPAGGGTSQTAVNSRAGACSQTAGLVTASLVLVTLLLLSPVIALLPQFTLASVVIVTTLLMIKSADFRAIYRVRRPEFWWAVIAVFGVVLFGTLNGILVAVVVSVLTLMYQANQQLPEQGGVRHLCDCKRLPSAFEYTQHQRYGNRSKRTRNGSERYGQGDVAAPQVGVVVRDSTAGTSRNQQKSAHNMWLQIQ